MQNFSRQLFLVCTATTAVSLVAIAILSLAFSHEAHAANNEPPSIHTTINAKTFELGGASGPLRIFSPVDSRKRYTIKNVVGPSIECGASNAADPLQLATRFRLRAGEEYAFVGYSADEIWCAAVNQEVSKKHPSVIEIGIVVNADCTTCEAGALCACDDGVTFIADGAGGWR